MEMDLKTDICKHTELSVLRTVVVLEWKTASEKM